MVSESSPFFQALCHTYRVSQNFELTKKRRRRYPAKTITDADYADDIAILANTPNQAETLLHSLEQAAVGIGLHVNEYKTEYMCFNQTGNISTLDGTSLKLVDKFTYLGSSVSSTKKDIDTRLTKAGTAIDQLSIIWKSDLTDKMKRSFFPSAVVSMHYLDANKTAGEKARRQLHKNAASNIEQVLEATPHKAPATRPPTSHHEKLSKLDEPDMQDTPGEVMYSNGPPHMAEQKQDDQLEHTYSIYVRIRDVALKTCQRRWTIGRSGERESAMSVLTARHDDDDDLKINATH